MIRSLSFLTYVKCIQFLDPSLLKTMSISNVRFTLPSYSLRERTSGAMYAGVPTVDLGLEWSSDDYTNNEAMTITINFQINASTSNNNKTLL